MGPIFGVSNLMQMYGHFEGCSIYSAFFGLENSNRIAVQYQVGVSGK